MDSAQARTALGEVGLEATRVEAIGGGWAYWTFDVDGRWIARFPRTEAVAAANARELMLLPELAGHVSFGVPAPTLHGSWQGRPFFAYRRIAGRSFHAADGSAAVLARLGAMLGELHSFPLDEAAGLLGTGPPESAWRDHFDGLWPVVETVALPEMDRALATRVEREFTNFLARLGDLPVCLIHNDLGLEHILIDEVTATPTGIIDFEDAWIGDPAVDFVPLRATLGQDALPTLLAGRDLGAELDDRMWFYHWMGSVHAIIYGVTAGVERERVDGLRELRRRLDTSL